MSVQANATAKTNSSPTSSVLLRIIGDLSNFALTDTLNLPLFAKLLTYKIRIEGEGQADMPLLTTLLRAKNRQSSGKDSVSPTGLPV